MRAGGMRLLFVLIALSSLAVGSCAGAGHRHPAWPPLPGVTATLKLWVYDSPNLDKDVVLKACQGWRHKGVACEFAASAEEANIRVREDVKPCVKDKDKDLYTLAWAYRGGDVYARTACFMRTGKMNVRALRTVITHEAGHELGIWDHVPLSCDKDEKDVKTHPTGRRICGPAVMNPVYDSDVPEITEIDGLAFDVRDLDVAVVSDHEGGDRGPDCVFEGH